MVVWPTVPVVLLRSDLLNLVWKSWHRLLQGWWFMIRAAMLRLSLRVFFFSAHVIVLSMHTTQSGYVSPKPVASRYHECIHTASFFSEALWMWPTCIKHHISIWSRPAHHTSQPGLQETSTVCKLRDQGGERWPAVSSLTVLAKAGLDPLLFLSCFSWYTWIPGRLLSIYPTGWLSFF